MSHNTIYSNNPHNVYNGMISAQRNMFLSSSLAIIMIGFSDKINHNFMRWIARFLSICILIISCYVGITSAYEFDYYLTHNKEKFPHYIPFNSWSNWKYINYAYIIFLLFIGTAFIFTKI